MKEKMLKDCLEYFGIERIEKINITKNDYKNLNCLGYNMYFWNVEDQHHIWTEIEELESGWMWFSRRYKNSHKGLSKKFLNGFKNNLTRDDYETYIAKKYGKMIYLFIPKYEEDEEYVVELFFFQRNRLPKCKGDTKVRKFKKIRTSFNHSRRLR